MKPLLISTDLVWPKGGVASGSGAAATRHEGQNTCLLLIETEDTGSVRLISVDGIHVYGFMKVLEIVSTFPPYAGGTGNVCFHNSRELAKRGHSVTVVTPSCSPRRAAVRISNVTVKSVRPIVSHGNASISPSVICEMAEDFDVIHLHGPYILDGLLTAVAAAAKRTPLVYTYHNDVIISGPMAWYPWIDRALPQRLIFSSASMCLFSTLDYALNSHVSHLVRRHMSKVRVVPIGVDTTTFNLNHDSAELAAVTDRYKLKPSCFRILFVGAMDRAHHFKGIPLLLKALSLISDDSLELVLIGDGDLRYHYESLSEKMGLANKVRFLGGVDQEELPLIYALSDVLVLPSRKIESFGIVLLEAMASGVPVIASKLPGVRKLVEESSSGLLFKPGDSRELASSIESLLRDANKAEELGRNGRMATENRYDWSVVGKSLESVLNDAYMMGDGRLLSG